MKYKLKQKFVTYMYKKNTIILKATDFLAVQMLICIGILYWLYKGLKHPVLGSGYILSNFWMVKGENKEVNKKLQFSTYKNHKILRKCEIYFNER